MDQERAGLELVDRHDVLDGRELLARDAPQQLLVPDRHAPGAVGGRSASQNAFLPPLERVVDVGEPRVR